MRDDGVEARLQSWERQLARTMRMLGWIDEQLERLEQEAGTLPGDVLAKQKQQLLEARERYDEERVRELILIAQCKHAGN